MKSNGNGTRENLLGWLKEARQVNTGYALAAFAVVAVIAMVSLLLAPKMKIMVFDPWQTLILIGMLLAALVSLVILGPRKAQGPTEVDRAQQPISAQIPVPEGRDFESIGPPKRNKLGILIDLSHDQHKWLSAPIFSVARDKLIHMIVPPSGDISWDLREIQDHRQLRAGDLAHWRGLLLGIPYHQPIKEETRNEIVQWVRQGGRLVMMGFELGDRHHGANLNELAKEFGLRFNSDIVAPKGWTPASRRPIDISVEFINIDSSHHPLLKEVRHLRLRNVCTLTIDPGSYVILNVGENGISWMKREFAKYVDGELRSTDAEYKVIDSASWVPLVAEAPEGLTGAGRVLAIGTWDLLGRGYELAKDSDNILFVRNLLNWLGGQAA